MSVSTGDLITRIYSGFSGVDFRGADIGVTRSPDSLNVWKDYKKLDSIRTRPAMRLLRSFDAPVYGIHFYNNGYKDYTFVHSGGNIYQTNTADFENGEVEPAIWSSGRAETPSTSFHFGNDMYIMGAGTILCYKGVDEQFSKINFYVPTTSIARKPAGGGTVYEDANMLTPYRINTFVGDGKSSKYHLDTENVKSIEWVKLNGTPVSNRQWSVEKGVVSFVDTEVFLPASFPAPDTAGAANVSIKFCVDMDSSEEQWKVVGCKLCQVFDNRVFFAGHPEYPNVLRHSGLDDPTYVSDLDYYNEGLDGAPITGLVAGNNALWVFREPSPTNTTIFYHTPTLDAEYGKIYPSQHSSVSTGCIGGAVNFNDDIVFFSERGLEGISGDITSEQVVAHRSSLVDRKMISESEYKNAVLAEWEGYLLVFIGNKVYLADSRSKIANNDHVEYEWFYWELEKKVTCARVYNGVLYLGTEDGVYALDDYEADVPSYWVTPKDKFSAPNKLKTTNKRGMVAEATGDVSVYVKVEDADFELIGEYKDVEDYFVSRIKRKKWKDIQLKFQSNTRFSLETATLEAFVGGYIKR